MNLKIVNYLSCVAFVTALVTGCNGTVESDTYIVLPQAETLKNLSPETQATFRVEAEIPGLLSKSPLQLDLANGRASGTFSLPETSDTVATFILTFYGGQDATTQEVLLGRIEHEVAIEKGEDNQASMPPFETSGALFDSNRNGVSNLDDLIAGIDPAPMPNPIDVSPQTISFESGVEVGGFTRSFFVLENNGDELVRLDLAVRLASGITIAPLEQIFEIGSEAPTDSYSFDLAPGEEQVMAITFAPSNALFVAGALSVNSTTLESNVQHGLMMRLIGNPEGAVPQPPASYAIPSAEGLTIDTYDGSIQSYQASKLFSREPDDAGSVEEHKRADGTDGTIGGQDVDDAYLVVVPPGYRFSLTLDGLNNDVDLFLFKANPTFNDEGEMTALDPVAFESEVIPECGQGLTIQPVDCSSNSGVSAEAVAFDGTQERDDSTYLIIALDRPELPAGQEELVEETNPLANTQDSTQEPSVQAAMYSLPEIDFVESSMECPDNGYGESACTEASGMANITILGVNFEVGLTVQVTWTDQLTGSAETQLAVCSAPDKGATVSRPVLGEEGVQLVDEAGEPVFEDLIMDQVVCVSPPAAMSPRLAPKANLVLRNPNGAVATRPQALTYLPPPPSVENVSPGEGPTTGGNTITVYGESFYEINGRMPTVAFGEYENELGNDVQYVVAEVLEMAEDGTELVVALPACPGCELNGPSDVTVVNPDLRKDSLGGAFQYFLPDGPDPIILDVVPNEGSTLGTDSSGDAGALVEGRGQVTILGQYFFDNSNQKIAKVLVDNQPLPVPPGGFNVIPAGGPGDYDQLIINMPPHEEGPVSIEIVNPGDQSDRVDGMYTYRLPDPEFEAMLPAQGLVSGNTVAVITGRYFQPGVKVFFGAIESGQVAFNSQSSLTVVVPPLIGAEAGPVDVTLKNLDLTEVVAENAFTYIDPTLPQPEISNVETTSGPIEGGNSVTIRGDFFQNGVRVLFGNTSALSVEYRSSQELVALAPPHAPGVVSLMVENPDGQSDAVLDAYTYFIPAPAIAALTPSSGPVAGGTTILIAGSGFQPGATVQFDGSPAMDASVYSSNLISCITPAAAEGAASVTVTNPAVGFEDALSVTSVDAFTFIEPTEAAPIIFGLSPDNGSAQGGTPVVIKGTGFKGANSEVYFGATQVSVIASTISGVTGGLEDTLTVIAPPHDVGGETVKVQNADGQADWTTFSYTANPPQLTVSGVIPSIGDSQASSSVLILGQGFELDSTVVFQAANLVASPAEGAEGCTDEVLTINEPIDNPVWISSSVLSVVLPPSELNLADPCINLSSVNLQVKVTNGSGEEAYKDDAFTYTQILNSVVRVETIGPGGLDCAAGGHVILTGKDNNQNGNLDDDEITESTFSCFGPNTVVEVTDGVGAESNCAVNELTGVTVCHGLDANGDGTLAGEESSCTYLCDGPEGDVGPAGVNAIVRVDEVESIAECEGGSGLWLRSGHDLNNNGILEPDAQELEDDEDDPEPVFGESWVCDPLDGLTAYAEVTEYNGPQCTHSGLKVVSGHDTNGIQGLQDEADEETETEADDVTVSYLCKPAPGLNSLIKTQPIDSDADGLCGLAGGVKLIMGLDVEPVGSPDGSLDGEENLIDRNVCNGQPGQDGAAGIDGLTALVLSTPLEPGESCPYGGHTVLTGLDSNSDLVLDELDDPAPVSSVLCNGAPGATGYSGLSVVTDLEEDDPDCPAGGVRVDYGLDTDNDQDLDDNDIPLGFYNLCHGIDGDNGINAVVEIESLDPDESEYCTDFGGVEIRIGYDDDADQVMDGEPVQVEWICNGIQGDSSLLVTETIAPGEICAQGGYTVHSGLDTNGEVGLQPAEYLSAWNVCNGENGISIISEMVVEVPGANCPNGGDKLVLAADVNANGNIDDGEAVETSYICDGANGLNVLVETSDVTTSIFCPQGGVEVATGQDDDGSGDLSEEEKDNVKWICEGHDSLISSIPLAADPLGCPAGGFEVNVGRDSNGNGVLDNAEVVGQQQLCNGVAGATGLSSLITTTPMTGVPCPTTGLKIETGVDSDGSGSLEEAEVLTTEYLCQGEAGANALAFTTGVLPDENCPAGGYQLTMGVDANANGVADDGETTEVVVCNGVVGADGLTSLVDVSDASGEACKDGGSVITTGLDADANGQLDPGEVSQTRTLCDGAVGASILASSVTATPEECATGGTKLTLVTDLDGDGAAGQSEPSHDVLVCNGGPGISSLVVVTSEPAGDNCVTGGQKLETGLDANGNGTLELEENPTVTYVCNGASGTSALVDMQEATAEDCPTGGFNIYYGVDTDADGVLAEDESSMALVCNGATGAAGAASLVVLDVTTDQCPTNGVVLYSGVDVDGNGVLDIPGEVVTTQVVCDGVNGYASLISSAEEPEGENCQYGGQEISVGLDDGGGDGTAADGVLHAAEVDQTFYVCDAQVDDGSPGPIIFSLTPPAVPAEMGGVIVIGGANFVVAGETPSEVWVNGVLATIQTAYSSTTELSVEIPPVTLAPVSSRKSGDPIGGTPISMTVENDDGKNDTAFAFYEPAECIDDGSGYCLDGYVCSFSPEQQNSSGNGGVTPAGQCVWSCDSDFILDEYEDCSAISEGWTRVCGEGTSCMGIHRSNARLALGYQGILVHGGDGGGNDLIFLTFDEQGDFHMRSVCDSGTCLNSRPERRRFHGFGGADENEDYLLFGGELMESGGLSDELWALDSQYESWTRLCGGDSGCSGPSARKGFVYNTFVPEDRGADVGNFVVVASEPEPVNALLFGGEDASGNKLGDLWAWTKAPGANAPAWEEVTCDGTCPSARSDAAFSWSGPGSLIMFGGELADGSFSDELWLYTDGAWQLLCGGASGCTSPPGVAGGALAVAPTSNDQLGYFLMGGTNANGLSDALWSGAMNPSTESIDWTQVCGAGTNCSGPTGVEGGLFISGGGPVFLFGGAVAGEVNDITWVYSGNTAEMRNHTCSDFGYVAGTLGCDSGCGFDVSQCVSQPLCGDGVVQTSAGEECDGSVPDGANDCSDFRLGSGAVTCGANCRYDYSSCAYDYRCGNGVKDHPQEACDGSNTISCQDIWQGIGSGARMPSSFMHNTPSCDNNCRLSVDHCQYNPCGNGNVDTSYRSSNGYSYSVIYSEACDPGNDEAMANTRGLTCADFSMSGSVLGCTSQCEIDLSNCVAYAASCSNGVLDQGSETDIDCGGSCGPCADEKTCADSVDCVSGLCEGSVCLANSCSDGVKNGKETDVDCGGPDCGACIKDNSCYVDEDCGACVDAGCTSSFTNGHGYRPLVCEAQKCKLTNYSNTCASDNDCASGICDSNNGQCLATRGDNMCPSGQHEIYIGNGEYMCAAPDVAACSGQSELSDCSFTSNNYGLSGKCYQGACVAQCNSWDTSSYGQCANENSFCQPVGILGDNNTGFVCIANTTFDADDECPAGTFEVAVGDGTYRCIPPSEHPCGGVADLNECSFSWNDFSVSGVCMSNTCVASCGSAGMTGFYTSGSRETCTNGNSICQPIGPVGDSSSLGVCMDLAQSCAVSGSPVDALCPAGSFGCMSSGQCGVPSFDSCVSGNAYAAVGTACSVDMDLDGVVDANEIGLCTPTDGSETICMANCSSGSCVATDSANQNHSYCQAIEPPGSGALEQWKQTGSVNGARDDYAVCLTSDSSCSSDADCKVESFVGCDVTNHVCLPPSLAACTNNDVPGAASQGTACDSDGDGSNDGLCVSSVDTTGDGNPDSASVCLVSCTTAVGGGDSSYCTTDGASCSAINNGQNPTFYVCSESD